MIQVIDKITYLPSNSTLENQIFNKSCKLYVEEIKKRVRMILSGGESATVTVIGKANSKIQIKITAENQDLRDRLQKALAQIRF